MKKTSKFLGSALAVSGVVAGSSVATAAQSNITFKIPAGPIDSVIAEFQRLTGLKVIMGEPEIGKIQTNGVAGSMSVEKAVDALLAGTKIRATFGPKTLTLNISQVSYQVSVTGDTMLASPKSTQPLRDTPQTVAVIPQQLFNQQGATTLREVLRNTPGITMSIGEGGSGGTSSGDNVLIRGFSARNDIYVDGTRDVGLVNRDSFNLETVEVAKGPGGVTAGRGATGGSINLVTKQASLFNAASVRITGGTADTKRGTLDVNRAINDKIAVRVNGMWQDSGYAGRDVAKYKSWGFSPAISFGLGTPTQVTLNYSRMKQNNTPDWGIPTLLPDVAIANHVTVNDLDWSNYYGIASRDFEKTTSDLVTATLSHKISAAMRVRNLTRFGKNYRDSVMQAPRPATTTAGQGPEDPGYNKNVAQLRRSDVKFQNRDDKNFTNQTDFSSTFRTGDLTHAFDAGVEITREWQPTYAMIDNFAFGRPPVTDLFNPTPYDTYRPSLVRSGASTDATSNTNAVYDFDNIKFKQLAFDLGLRYDDVSAKYTNVTTANVTTNFNRTDKVTTGRASILFKPVPAGTLYAAYSTAFYPSFDGTLGITLAATGLNSSSLTPEMMENIEGGAKWVLRQLLLVQAAVFQMEKTNARTVDGAGNQVLAGDQRVRGAEFNVTGHIMPNWSVFSGLSLMRGKVIASGVAVEVGSELAYVPHVSFNFFTSYEWPKGLSIGAGVNHESGHFHNQTGGFLFVSGATAQPKYVENAAVIQDKTEFWTANAMAAYAVNKHLNLQANLNNIFNERYADRSYDRHFLPGPTRQLLVNSIVSW
jgi:catecholate siderophore receptor